MELAVSILGIKENLKKKIDELNKTKASFLHIDIMDGMFVPNIHDNFVELEKSLKDNKKRIDVHLMVEDVERYVNIYKNIHPEYITFHYEISDSIDRIINIIKGNNIKVGLAIKPNTDISALLSYMDKLDLILVMMIIGSLNFSNAFGVDVFEKFHQSVMNVKINGWPIFARILGSSLEKASLGNWTSVEFTCLMLLATIVLSIIYRIKVDDILDDYKEGAKSFIMPALLVVFAYVSVVVTTNHPFLLTILKPLLTITDGFNSVTLSISMFITSIFKMEPYYIATSVLPYVGSIVEDTSVYALIGFITQGMQGLSMLIAPTSIVLLAVISYLKVNYTKWFKGIIAFFGELLLVSFIIFTIILLV